jgi:S1-C subfamily serine protease
MKANMTKIFYAFFAIILSCPITYADWDTVIKGGTFTRVEKYKPSSVELATWIAGDLKELISAAEKGDPEAQYLLGRCYDIREEYEKSLKWYESAAKQGHKDAKQLLQAVDDFDPVEMQKAYDIFYEDTIIPMLSENPEYVEPSTKDGYSGRIYPTETITADALSGDAWAQNVLGTRYEKGDRVIEDYAEAYAWFLISSMNGNDKAKQNKERFKPMLSQLQVASAQKRAKQLNSEIERKKAIANSNPNEALSGEISPSGYGSGFLVKGGFILTCWHVVDGAERISIVVDGKDHIANLVQHDEANDIAVLQILSITSAPALNYSDEAKLGQKVFTLGFPHPDLQGTDVKFTTGTISSLTGIGNSPRYYQISAPLQSGNSGGALFNEKGNFIGIVAAKLDSIATLSMTGDLPQNVNYAIKAGYAIPLLKTIEGFEVGSKRNDETNLLDLIEELKQSVVMIKVY